MNSVEDLVSNVFLATSSYNGPRTRVFLSENLIQVDSSLNTFFPRFCFKSEFDHSSLGDWGKLEEIACHDELDTSERLVWFLAESTSYMF